MPFKILGIGLIVRESRCWALPIVEICVAFASLCVIANVGLLTSCVKADAMHAFGFNATHPGKYFHSS